MESLGPYRLEAELGRGAMGVVYRGFDPAIGRPVAIKVIQFNTFAASEEQAKLRLRFAREAAAAGRLSHPNIVTIFQFGEEGSLQYLVQELIEGGSLDQLIRQHPLTPGRALAILAQVAAGLDYAHARGVVHRDVKPANILIDTEGRAKLTDFGIARVAAQTITGTNAVLGTPAYMAPEQIQGLKLDGRSDQFALAVVAYQLLAGRRPFSGDTHTALIYQILHVEPEPIHVLNRALPAAMSRVLWRALAKKPANRFATCAEFASALAASLVSRPEPVPRKPLPKVPVVLDAPHLLPEPKRADSHRWLWITIGLLAVAGLILQKFAFLDQPSTTSGVSASPTAQVHPPAPKTVPKSSPPKKHQPEPEQVATAPARPSPEPPPPMSPAPSPSKALPAAQGFADIYFEPGSSKLDRDALAAIARIAKGLTQYLDTFRDDVVFVDGYADESEGTASECALLASDRAAAVHQTLAGLRVPTDRLRAASNGSRQPQCTDATPECRQKNRRVHFRMRQ